MHDSVSVITQGEEMARGVPAAVRLEDVQCPLGCASGDEIVLTGRDRLHDLPGEFTVVKCRQCGLMRTNPRPTQEAMGYYYPGEYGPHQEVAVSDVGGTAAGGQSLAGRMARRVIRFHSESLPPVPPGRLLEVGCGSGRFLHKMAGLGWEVRGMEFSEHAAAAARRLGYPVDTGALETAAEHAQHYDLIVGWMVLEHLHHPVEALMKLGRWVKPGGWLAVSVPNAAALEFRLFKDRWYALQLPTHLFHFTPRTLALVLERGGWHMEKVYHQRILTNFFYSLGYALKERNPDSRWAERVAAGPGMGVKFNVAMYPLAWLLSHLGQTGRMTVWARRT